LLGTLLASGCAAHLQDLEIPARSARQGVDRQALERLSPPVLRRFLSSQLILQEEAPGEGERADDRAERAATLLEEAIGLAPEQAALWRYLAEAWASKPDPQRAARAARRAVELDESDPRSHFVLGLQLQRLGDWSGAERHLVVAVKQGIGGTSAHLPHYYLFEVRRRQGNVESALATLRDWRVAIPESSDPLVLRARLLWSAGRGAEAGTAAVTALQAEPRSQDALVVLLDASQLDLWSAVEALELVLRSDWSVSTLHQKLATLYENIGRYDLALDHLLTLRTLSSGSPQSFQQREARLRLAMFQGDEALSLLEDKIEADGAIDGQLISLLAECYLVTGRREEGVARLEELRSQYASVDAEIDHGLAQLKPAANEEASSGYDSVGSSESIVEALALLEERQRSQSTPRTGEEYEQWALLEQQRTNLQVRLSFARRAEGDRNGSEAILTEVVARHPRLVGALNALAYLWAEDGRRLDEALEMQQRALEQRPFSGALQDTLGWILYRMGRTEEALVILELANRYLPDNFEVLEHLGDALFSLGREDEARRYYGDAARLLPSSGYDDVRARLGGKTGQL